METAPPPLPASIAAADACLCPKCGTHVDITRLESLAKSDLEQAQQRILDLETQVRLLNEKAAAAVDRMADYEDELGRLRQRRTYSVNEMTPPPSSIPVRTATPTVLSRSSLLAAGAASRLSALLSPRPAKSTPNLKAAAVVEPRMPGSPGTPASGISSGTGFTFTHSAASSYSSVSATSPTGLLRKELPLPPISPGALLEALSREQMLRRQAEGRLQDTSREVEELSVTLFTQANEMVAEERRQRAHLERRVAMLEQRDIDKNARLARLEQAMARIERLHTLLGKVAGVPEEPSTLSGPVACQ